MACCALGGVLPRIIPGVPNLRGARARGKFSRQGSARDDRKARWGRHSCRPHLSPACGSSKGHLTPGSAGAARKASSCSFIARRSRRCRMAFRAGVIAGRIQPTYPLHRCRIRDRSLVRCLCWNPVRGALRLPSALDRFSGLSRYPPCELAQKLHDTPEGHVRLFRAILCVGYRVDFRSRFFPRFRGRQATGPLWKIRVSVVDVWRMRLASESSKGQVGLLIHHNPDCQWTEVDKSSARRECGGEKVLVPAS